MNMAYDINLSLNDQAVINLAIYQAEKRVNELRQFEPKPWRRTAKQNDQIDTLSQFAVYARRMIKDDLEP